MSAVHHAQMPEVNNEPFAITGIVANEAFYFIAGLLHRRLKLDFKRVKNFEFYNESQNKCYEVATCIYLDGINGLIYLLINNTLPVIEGLKAPDCILMVIGRDCEPKSKELIKQMLKLKQIMTCKLFYPLQQPKESGIVTGLQGSLFDSTPVNGYENIKKKRKKVSKTVVFDEQVIKNIRLDLETNFCNEDIFV
ncbi:MAG: hypothetical protein J6P44_01815 [Bacteroidales bacterium]|nr:hypothetical protein [Bacteroidales bacterium]